MPTFAVRFKGMLTKDERKRLAAAGLEITGSKSSLVAGTIGTGRPIYTVETEAPTAEEALARVRAAIDPDTANFSGWEVGAA
jgi:dihydrodipicolinate synthase/N-acetylneuraminate lyase